MSVVQLTLMLDAGTQNRIEAPHLRREVVESEVEVVVSLMVDVSIIGAGLNGVRSRTANFSVESFFNVALMFEVDSWKGGGELR